MTTPHPLRRTRRGRIVAAFGGSLLAVSAIVTAGTGTAEAAPPAGAEILTAGCTHYEPNPTQSPQVSSCPYANLSGANLSGANLTNADLLHANLSGANLTGANLTGATAMYANLTGANLTNANLTGMDAADATFSGANLTGTIVIPGNVRMAASSPDGAAVTIPNPPFRILGLPFGGCLRPDNTVVPIGTEITFPVGITTVTCTAANIRGLASGTFTVTVDPGLGASEPPTTGSLGSLDFFGFGR